MARHGVWVKRERADRLAIATAIRLVTRAWRWPDRLSDTGPCGPAASIGLPIWIHSPGAPWGFSTRPFPPDARARAGLLDGVPVATLTSLLAKRGMTMLSRRNFLASAASLAVT